MNTIDISPAEAPISFFGIYPRQMIQFVDAGVVVGSLSIVDGELCFTGNADAAAKVFFDEILKRMCDEYMREAKR